MELKEAEEILAEIQKAVRYALPRGSTLGARLHSRPGSLLIVADGVAAYVEGAFRAETTLVTSLYAFTGTDAAAVEVATNYGLHAVADMQKVFDTRAGRASVRLGPWWDALRAMPRTLRRGVPRGHQEGLQTPAAFEARWRQSHPQASAPEAEQSPRKCDRKKTPTPKPPTQK